jgi:type IV pilus assembly protein PilW
MKPKENGFTLIELMIAMAITGIVTAAIYAAFHSQQKSYIVQEDVADMQQNLRAGMDLMVREIRMAGFDPTSDANAGIVSATSNAINFTMDAGNGVDDDGDGSIDETDEMNAGNGVDDDGDGSIDEADEMDVDGDTNDANENITFGFSNANDADNDGIADSGAADIGRNTGGGFQPVAENIHAIEFFYTLADGTQTSAPAAVDLNNIRSVQITFLARADRIDQNFYNATPYTTPGGQNLVPYNDSFRRRLVTTTVKCRNMGL